MIEELKILAEMMTGVTNGVITIGIMYMIINLVKVPIVFSVIGFFTVKCIKCFTNKEITVVDIEKV